MNDFQQTAFNTIDAINKNDEAKFYEGVAKMAEKKHVNSEAIVFEICKILFARSCMRRGFTVDAISKKRPQPKKEYIS